jgi:L-rhamnose isomerase
MNPAATDKLYLLAREKYAALDVATDQACEALGSIAISLHCWQGDDVAGFEPQEANLTAAGSR